VLKSKLENRYNAFILLFSNFGFMSKKFNVCVVGATGAVGETILSILDECAVLSITIQPACAAIGAYFSEMLPPAENKPTCA
jgi:hypothetical protein